MTYHFQCVDCAKEYKKDELEYVCPACSAKQKPMEPTCGVLKVIYDYDDVVAKLALPKSGIVNFGFAYSATTPLDSLSSLPPLQVGPTPLVKPERLAKELGLKNLYIKNDTVLPTGSFKDRASSLVVAKARELKKDVIVCASTGNAASALAGMCASVGMKCVIFVPASAPAAKLTQIAIYGARLIPVKGTYDDACELSLQATKKFGWYNRNTAYNPFTTEGKKSVAFEIFEQLGNKVPDKILIPTGDGVILTGVYKGFWDLQQLGLIKKLPQLIAVQAEGSCVITKMIQQKGLQTLVCKDVHTKVCNPVSGTIADSISVSAPRNANWAIETIKETQGFAVTVTDEEILASIKKLGTLTGIFAEPAAAASLAGLIKIKASGSADLSLQASELVILLVTGTGLKDIPSAQKAIKMPQAISSLDEISKF